MNSPLHRDSITHLISIAVGNYPYLSHLKNAIQDSDDIVEVLKDKYKVSLHKKLHDEEVTRQNIVSTFNSLKSKLQYNDSVLVFFNGHGKDKNDDAYWLFSDSTEDSGTWYSCLDFLNEIKGLRDAKHIAIFVNSCSSGNMFFIPNRGNEDGVEKSRVLFTSGRAFQPVDDVSSMNSKNSPFTDAILKALRKNNDIRKLPLRNVIGFTIGCFDTSDSLAKPRDGYFTGHEGGEFYLYLKKDEEVYWQELQRSPTIEGYEYYIQKFPAGSNFQNAWERKEALIRERQEWLQCVESIKSNLTNFIKNYNADNADFKNDAVNLEIQVTDIINKLTEENRAEEAWQDIKSGKSILDFKNFIRDFPNSKYILQAQAIIDHLEAKEKEEIDWEKIRKAHVIPRNKRKNYAEYLVRYSMNGKYTKDAMDKIRELDLWMEIAGINGNDVAKKREKLKQYQQEFPNGDYKREVENALYEFNIQTRAKRRADELQDAIATNNIQQIQDILNYLEDLDDEEKKVNEETYKTAKEKLTAYEEELEKDFQEAITKDKCWLLTNFIKKYKEGEKVEIVIRRLEQKDDEMFDLAEQSKSIYEFRFYLQEFENCDEVYRPVFIADTKIRVEELEFFNKISSKEEFVEYLKSYPKGLMRGEAEEQIKNIEYTEEKQRRYEQIFSEDSIDLCTAYLDDYKEEDGRQSKVIEKLKELQEIEDENKLFLEIEMAEGEEQLRLANKYIIDFEGGKRLEDVIEIKKKVEAILKDNDDFNKAVETLDINKFEAYKEQYPTGLNLSKADDYIVYLRAKEENDINKLRKYLREFPNGINVSKAHDCIEFFEARNSRDISLLEKYLSQPHRIYENLALELKDELILEQKEEDAFCDAKEKDDIISWRRFLHGSFPLKAEHEEYAKNRIEELKRKEQDEKDFKEAQKSDKEEDYLNYIKTYGNKGNSYKEATKRLLEKQLGITQKDTDVLLSVEYQTESINNLSSNFTNFNKSAINLGKKASRIGIILAVIFLGLLIVLGYIATKL